MCLAKKDGGLGFRDLKCFNLALLAKQCWRLLHNQDSLLYKIYKAKYFPNISFLEATVPSHSSYAWRSITHGRELIKQRSRWRVGNGLLIKIWADIPIKKSFLLELFYHLKQELQILWNFHHSNLDGKRCSLIPYSILLKPYS